MTTVSVTSFIEEVMKIKRQDEVPTAFRGHRNYQWKLVAPIYRVKEHTDFENEMIRELISTNPQDFYSDQTMFDRLLRMQHYGLPTRLLDVTTNPLVALYFACLSSENGESEEDGAVICHFVPSNRRKYFDSDAVSLISNLANLKAQDKDIIVHRYQMDNKYSFNRLSAVQRLIHFVRIEKPGFLPKIEHVDLFRPLFVKPKMTNRRIISQSGAFIIYGLIDKTGNKPYKADLASVRIRIPHDKKGIIIDQLSRLGINASTLFPEIDKAAEYIVNRYKHGSYFVSPKNIGVFG